MAWNASDGVKAPEMKPKKGGLNGLVAGAIIVIAAVVVFFAVRSLKREEPKAEAVPESAPREIAEVAPSIPSAKVEEPAKPDDDAKKRARAEKLKRMTTEERMDYLFEEAEKRPLNLEPASNRVFATGTEQLLSWIFTTEVGDMPPPLAKIPMFDEAHLYEILNAGNPVKDGDSEQVQNAKRTVELAKAELRKYLDEGGLPEDFLEYYHGQLRQAHIVRQEAQQSVFKMVREEPELVGEYLKSVNADLDRRGIKPVKIPKPMADRFGIRIDE